MPEIVAAVDNMAKFDLLQLQKPGFPTDADLSWWKESNRGFIAGKTFEDAADSFRAKIGAKYFRRVEGEDPGNQFLKQATGLRNKIDGNFQHLQQENDDLSGFSLRDVLLLMRLTASELDPRDTEGVEKIRLLLIKTISEAEKPLDVETIQTLFVVGLELGKKLGH
jgi:hypothetical protein